MYQYIQHEITCVQIYHIQALLSTKYNGWRLGMRMTVSCSNGARMCFQSMKRRQNKLCKTIFRTFSFPVNNAEYLFGVFLKTMTSMQVWKFEIKIRRCNWNIRRIYIIKMMIIFFPKTSSHVGLIWRRKGILHKNKLVWIFYMFLFSILDWYCHNWYNRLSNAVILHIIVTYCWGWRRKFKRPYCSFTTHGISPGGQRTGHPCRLPDWSSILCKG